MSDLLILGFVSLVAGFCVQHLSEGPCQPPNTFRSFSQNQILGGPKVLFPSGNPSIEVGDDAPTSIDGFPGGEMPFGPPKLGFGKSFSMGWVAARGPPSSAERWRFDQTRPIGQTLTPPTITRPLN